MAEQEWALPTLPHPRTGAGCWQPRVPARCVLGAAPWHTPEAGTESRALAGWRACGSSVFLVILSLGPGWKGEEPQGLAQAPG